MKKQMDDLILVIDMQNVYLPNQPWGCKNIKKAIFNILTIIKQYHKNIIFTKFIASENPKGVWKEYNKINEEIIKNKFLNEIISDFSILSKKFPCYNKSTYSSMTVPQIREEALKHKRLVITGVVAECCVLSTCFEAIDLGCKIIYLSDAVAGIDDDTEKSVVKVLIGLFPLHVEIMTTSQYLKSLGNEDIED